MIFSFGQGIEALNTLGRQNIPTFFLVDYSAKHWFICPLNELPLWKIRYSTIRKSIPSEFRNSFNQDKTNPTHGSPARLSTIELPPRDIYQKSFQLVQEEERAGNSFLCNLTFPSRVTLSGNLEQVFHETRAEFRLLVDDPRIHKKSFCVFSPEGFISIRNSIIDSKPMKGTRYVLPGKNPAIELNGLMADEKEAAEHRTIVDLIRNDLGIVSQRVWVDSYRYAQEITLPEGMLWATSSRICGQLSEDWQKGAGTLLAALLPAGSITGAPKKETCRIIADAELEDREFYTGVAGIVGPWGLDSWVLIRYLEQDNIGYRFRSGGGITIYSREEDEYAELEAKIALPRG